MMSRLSLIFSVLAVLLITLSGCAGVTPTLDATGTNSPDPTSIPTETPSPTPEPPTSTPTETPIPLPVLDLDIDVPLLQGFDDLPTNALARIGVIPQGINIKPFPDSSGVILWASSNIYAYRLPGFEPMWRQYLEPGPTYTTFSEDGKLMTAYHYLSGGCREEAVVFDAETGQLVDKYFPDDDSSTTHGSVRVVQLEPEEVDGEFIHGIEVYDNDEYVGQLESPPTTSHSERYYEISILPNRDLIVASADRKFIYVWRISTLELLHWLEYSGNNNWGRYTINPLFGPDGKYITYFDEGRLNVALTETGEIVYQSEGAVHKYQWSPDALFMSRTDKVQIISIDGWSEVYSSEEDVNYVHFDRAPYSGDMAVLNQNGVLVFSTESLELEYTVPFTQQSGGMADWSDDGKWLEVNEFDAPNIIINHTTGEPVVAPFEAGVRLINAGKAFLLTADRLFVADLDLGKIIGGVQYTIMPQSLEWAKDEEALIIEGPSKMWLWSEATNELREIESMPETHPGIVPFEDTFPASEDSYPSPDGQINALAINNGYCGDGPCCCGCGYESSVLQLYHNGSEQPFAEYPFEPGIAAIAWSPDGKLLALGHTGFGSYFHDALWAGRISLIDPGTGQVLQTLEGHSGGITGLLFSPDGSRLASTSEDGTIIIWAVGDQ